MSDGEIEFILRRLKSGMRMLEWGCGGSTVFFGSRVAQLDSIEHDIHWAERTRQLVGSNTTIHHVQLPSCRKLPAARARRYDARYRNFYAGYAAYPGKIWRNQPYDIVLIDGRARLYCARNAVRWLAPHGMVFVNDFFKVGREKYLDMLRHYKLVDSLREEGEPSIALLAPRARR